MSEAQPTRSIGRSVAAVFAGFVVVVVLSLGADAVLHATGVFPREGAAMSNALFLLATVYRTVFGIGGSYTTAWLAPNKPLQHALVGGVIGLVLSILGAVTTWNENLGPHWYPLALVVTALPSAWLGGQLRLMQLRTSQP